MIECLNFYLERENFKNKLQTILYMHENTCRTVYVKCKQVGEIEGVMFKSSSCTGACEEFVNTLLHALSLKTF